MKKIILFVTFITVTFCINAQDLDGKIFKIQSADPNSKGKFLGADSHTLGTNETKIQLWDGNDEAHQHWKLVKVSSASAAKDIYFIVNMSSKAGEYNYLCPSEEYLGKNGGEIGLSKKRRSTPSKSVLRDKSAASQFWRVTKNDDNTYKLETAMRNYKRVILDADGNSLGKNGGKVQLWESIDTPNQAWKLIPLE